MELLEACGRCDDVKNGGIEFCTSGTPEWPCRCANVNVSSCGALEPRYWRSGVEAWRIGALEVPDAMRGVLLCMLEAVEGELCWLEVPEMIRRVLLCMLEAVEGALCLLDAVEVREVRQVGEVWQVRDVREVRQVRQVREAMEVPDAILCVLLLYILPGEIAAERDGFLPQFIAVFSPPLDPCLFAALTEVREQRSDDWLTGRNVYLEPEVRIIM